MPKGCRSAWLRSDFHFGRISTCSYLNQLRLHDVFVYDAIRQHYIVIFRVQQKIIIFYQETLDNSFIACYYISINIVVSSK